MKSFKIMTTVMVGLILTMCITVLSILWAMFSTHGDNERTEGLFGGVFFESSSSPDGSVMGTMGLNNYWIIIGLFVIICIFLLAAQVFFRKLNSHKKSPESPELTD